MPTTPVPGEIRDALRGGQKVVCGPVTVRPPTNPHGRGAVSVYRVEWRCPVTGKREAKTRRDIDEALALAVAEADRLDTSTTAPAAKQRPSGRPGTLGGLADAYLDPGLHPGWSENRRRTVTSLVTNWMAASSLRVVVDGHHVAAPDLPLARLTPSVAEQILAHAHRQKAHRTYRDVHRELKTMLRWAGREGLFNDAAEIVDRIALALPPNPDRTGTANRNIKPVDPSEIPGLHALDALRRAARADDGPRGALFVDILAFGGLRIGEALALSSCEASLTFDDQELVYRPHVWRRAHRTTRETRPPKHHRNRHAWLPPWMTDQVDEVLTLGGQWLFPAPKGGLWSTDAFRKRRFNTWLEAAGWPKLPNHDTRQRVWKWTAHSLRHHAASWMLNELSLPPDDVAEFLGHATGHQVWVMYSRVQSGLTARATNRAREVGDPRITLQAD
jgi:integrase